MDWGQPACAQDHWTWINYQYFFIKQKKNNQNFVKTRLKRSPRPLENAPKTFNSKKIL